MRESDWADVLQGDDRGLVVEIRVPEDGLDFLRALAARPAFGWEPLGPVRPHARRLAMALRYVGKASTWDCALDALVKTVDELGLHAGLSPNVPDWQTFPASLYRKRKSPRIWVAPSWCVRTDGARGVSRPSEDGVREVWIDPGWAFGCGTHPSTRSCVHLMEWMEGRGRIQGGRVLDVGTGTGILALIAARMGAAGVVAVDVDSDAIELARGNVARNGLSGSIEITDSPLHALPEGGFDVVLANLTAACLARLFSDIVARLAENGVLLVAGFTVRRSPQVKAAGEKAGLLAVQSHRVDCWEALAFHGRAAGE